MSDSTEKNKSISETSSSEAQIAGKPLQFFWQSGRIFVIILVLAEIANEVFEVYEHGRWVIAGAISITFTYLIARRARTKLATAVAANAFVGVIAGLLLAVWDIIWYHQWYYILNLVRMPFILALIGMAGGFIFYVLFRSILTNKEIKESKGGGIYGRTKSK